jgi:hypothetical protein
MNDHIRSVENEALAPLYFHEAKKPNEKQRTRTRSHVRTLILVGLAALIAFVTYHFVTSDRPSTNTRPRAGGPACRRCDRRPRQHQCRGPWSWRRNTARHRNSENADQRTVDGCCLHRGPDRQERGYSGTDRSASISVGADPI